MIFLCPVLINYGLGILYADKMFRTIAEAKGEGLNPVKPV